MLACSECAFKCSRSGDLVTQAVDVLVFVLDVLARVLGQVIK